MTNCIFGFPSENWAALRLISASAEVVGLGAGQMQNDHGSTATSWQTPGGVTTASVTVDAGGAVEWGVAGLFNTNLTPSATVRWRVASDGTFATSAYDSGTLSGAVAHGYRQSVHVLPQAVTARYLRCDISDWNNPEGVLRVAQIYAGPARRPVRNFGYGSAVARQSIVAVVTTRGGQEYAEARFARRAWSVSLPSLAQSDVYPLAMEMQRAAEDGRNLLFVPQPGSSDIQREAVFGRLSAASAISWPAQSPHLRAWSCTITERL